MPIFRSIVFSAALAGLIVGAVISVAQFLGTVPLIQKSEVYERKAAAGAPPAAHEQLRRLHMSTLAPPIITIMPVAMTANGSPKMGFSATPSRSRPIS